MNEVVDIFSKVETDPSIEAAVIISKKPGCFIAGADISMLNKVKSATEGSVLAAEGQAIMQRIEDCPKPVVAAIMGSCLGGKLTCKNNF